MKFYPIQLEISGPIALWAHPDTMPNPVCHRLHAKTDWNHGPNGAGLDCGSGSLGAFSWVL